MKETKKYSIILSERFPVTHPRAGAETDFIGEFYHGRGCVGCPNQAWCDESKEGCVFPFKKLHTIRANYELWKKRIEAVQRGEDVINIRVWNGKPYRSKTTLIASLSASDGVGLQKIEFERGNIYKPLVDGHSQVPLHIANNDGLCFFDWQEWFSGYDLSKSLAIIHFTKFRY